MILELCKGVHCVDLGESFQTHIFLQNLASIQPRTSPVKFARPSNAAASEQDHFAEVQFVLRDFMFAKAIKDDFSVIEKAQTANEMLAKRLDAYKYRSD